MRDLSKIIEAMVRHIPETERSLLARLAAAKGTALYTAPEAMTSRWVEVRDILEEEIGEPTEQWQHCVAAIFVGVQP